MFNNVLLMLGVMRIQGCLFFRNSRGVLERDGFIALEKTKALKIYANLDIKTVNLFLLSDNERNLAIH